MRETKEEIGCDVRLIRYLCYKDFTVEGRHFRSHKYLAEIAPGQAPRVNEPTIFSHLFWLPMKDYKSYSVAPNVKEFCEDYVQGKLKV